MRHYVVWTGIIALWAAFIGLAWFMSQASNSGLADFRVYYEAAHTLNRGMPLYRGSEGMVYLYPPLTAQLLMPLASQFTFETAYSLWFIFNILLLIGSVALISQHSSHSLWLWVMTPLFLPILQALAIGQVTIVLLALFAGTWIAIQRELRELAGSLLALAAWIKVFPAFVILYFLWRRDWQVVRGAIISSIVLGFLQIGISGISPMLEMPTVLFSLSSTGQDVLVAVNASPLGFASQLFEAHPNVSPLFVSPMLYTFTRLILTLTLVGGFFYLTRSSQTRSFDLEYALALLTALLLSPTLFPTSMPPVLLTYFLLLRNQPTKPILWFCTIACTILSLYWLHMVGYASEWRTSGVLLSFGFYTLFATWCVIAYRLSRYGIIRTEIQFAQKV